MAWLATETWPRGRAAVCSGLKASDGCCSSISPQTSLMSGHESRTCRGKATKHSVTHSTSQHTEMDDMHPSGTGSTTKAGWLLDLHSCSNTTEALFLNLHVQFSFVIFSWKSFLITVIFQFSSLMWWIIRWNHTNTKLKTAWLAPCLQRLAKPVSLH